MSKTFKGQWLEAGALDDVADLLRRELEKVRGALAAVRDGGRDE